MQNNMKKEVQELSQRIEWLEKYDTFNNPDDFVITEDGTLTEYNGIDEIVRIPSSVKVIGGRKINNTVYGAFEKNKNLKQVIIPDSVISICDEAFHDCSDLIGINIPDSVKSIGKYAICRCTSLTNINIPDSVTEIGENAFKGCKNLIVTVSRNCKFSLDLFADCKEVKLR